MLPYLNQQSLDLLCGLFDNEKFKYDPNGALGKVKKLIDEKRRGFN